jgi:putative tryptophan/tyrosine transport system substrate-binding protein
LQLQFLEVRSSSDFEEAFEAATRGAVHALFVPADPLLNTHAKRIRDLAAKNRLPAMYPGHEHARAGGFMSYGANPSDLYQRAAVYVHKILKGAKPADLAIEQPTKFELVINLTTAKALGLTIQPSILLTADEVIE